jgi:large conductance mechanosensitive channel
VIGAAFGKIVTSLVNDVVMPPIGLLLGGIDFGNLFVTLKGPRFDTLKAARDGGAVTVNYGVFINTVIEFLIVGLVIFLVIKAINRMKRQPAELPPATKACAYCCSTIAIEATRCPQCTSDLKAA